MGTRQERPSALYRIHIFQLFYALSTSHQRPTKNLNETDEQDWSCIITFICSYSYSVMIKLTFSNIRKSANRISSNMTSFFIIPVKAQVNWLLVDSSTVAEHEREVEKSNLFQWAAFEFWDLQPVEIVSAEHVKITAICHRAASINLCSASKVEVKIFIKVLGLSAWVSDNGSVKGIPWP